MSGRPAPEGDGRVWAFIEYGSLLVLFVGSVASAARVRERLSFIAREKRRQVGIRLRELMWPAAV